MRGFCRSGRPSGPARLPGCRTNLHRVTTRSRGGSVTRHTARRRARRRRGRCSIRPGRFSGRSLAGVRARCSHGWQHPYRHRARGASSRRSWPRPVPQSGSEVERFFDLSLDLLVIAGFDGYLKRVEPSVRADARVSDGGAAGAADAGCRAPRGPGGGAQRALRSGARDDVVGFENRVICADRSVRWLQWNTRAMPEQGIVYGVGRDVTDRRRADAELTRPNAWSRPVVTSCACSQTSSGSAPRRDVGGTEAPPAGVRGGRRGAGAAPRRQQHGVVSVRGR